MTLLLLVIAFCLGSTEDVDRAEELVETEKELDDTELVIELDVTIWDKFVTKYGAAALVVFNNPSCEHCETLAPIFEETAKVLKAAGSPVKLAKVDPFQEQNRIIGEQYQIVVWPTVKLFRDHSDIVDYTRGGWSVSSLVAFVNRELTPPSTLLTSKEEIDNFLNLPQRKTIAFIPQSFERTWTKFCRTTGHELYKHAHVLDPTLFDGRMEGTLEIHKRGEDVVSYTMDKAYSWEYLEVWWEDKSVALVEDFSSQNWNRVRDKKGELLILFQNDTEIGIATQLAKTYDNILVMTTEKFNNAHSFGPSGKVFPTAVYCTFKDGLPTTIAWNEEKNDEWGVASLKAFVNGCREGTYQGHTKSQPIPENNVGDVKIVVRDSFYYYAGSGKDLLLQFYAPWCHACKEWAPLYEELGALYRHEDVIIGKMDITQNSPPPGMRIVQYPTIILFAANGGVYLYAGELSLEGVVPFIEQKRATKSHLFDGLDDLPEEQKPQEETPSEEEKVDL